MPRSDLLRNVAEAKGAYGKADVALTPFPSPADGIVLARGKIWVKQQKCAVIYLFRNVDATRHPEL